ncbi:MAG: Mg2+ and Co2+ transporter CorB [Clostridiales bacterium]
MDDKHPYKGKKFKKKHKFKKNSTITKSEGIKWVSIITVVSFLLSIIITIFSINLIHGKSVYMALTIVFIIIFISLFFDLIGTATTAANEYPFHSMAARKKFAAKRAIILCRNAEKVSTLCNDVVGDICGIISGASSTYIVIMLIGKSNGVSIVELILTGIVASLTVGGKALGKILAIKYSTYIVYKISIIIEFILISIRYKSFSKKFYR